MTWQRKIPFGYQMKNGEIQPQSQEAEAVRQIFRLYLTGESLSKISEAMMRDGVRYHQHTAQWNKNMVKRILENESYRGREPYPQLVEDETFRAIRLQREERTTYAPFPKNLSPIRGKLECKQCGAKLNRDTKRHGRPCWRCANPECGITLRIDDLAMEQLADHALLELAENPERLHTPKQERPRPSAESRRMENELTLALNRGETGNPVRSLILAMASERYNALPDPTPRLRLSRLRVRLETETVTKELLLELLDTAVRAIRIGPEETIELILQNQNEQEDAS